MTFRIRSKWITGIAAFFFASVVVACGGGGEQRDATADATDTVGGDTAGEVGTDTELDAGDTSDAESGDSGPSNRTFRSGSFQVGNCSAPDSCPTPDNDKRYDITCVNRDSAPVGKAFELHIYGKHVADARAQSSSVKVVWSEDLNTGGSNPTNGPEVSDCHVKAQINVPSANYSSGDSVQVGIVRAGTGGEYVDLSLK